VIAALAEHADQLLPAREPADVPAESPDATGSSGSSPVDGADGARSAAGSP
jgi:hypothetical protein